MLCASFNHCWLPRTSHSTLLCIQDGRILGSTDERGMVTTLVDYPKSTVVNIWSALQIYMTSICNIWYMNIVYPSKNSTTVYTFSAKVTLFCFSICKVFVSLAQVFHPWTFLMQQGRRWTNLESYSFTFHDWHVLVAGLPLGLVWFVHDCRGSKFVCCVMNVEWKKIYLDMSHHMSPPKNVNFQVHPKLWLCMISAREVADFFSEDFWQI